MADVKLVFYCNAKYIEYPPWLTRPAEIDDYPVDFAITLDRNATKLQAELFLLSVSGFECFTHDFGADVATLLAENEPGGFVVSGGIVFWDTEHEIRPGCCSGVENWRESMETVEAGESPFMGHDPWPGITYKGERVFVWQEGPLLPGEEGRKAPALSNAVTFDRKELLQKLRELGETNLREFLEGPFRTRMRELDATQADPLLRALMLSMRV